MSKQRYPEEFKTEAVKQITERGHKVADVSARLGVSQHSLWENGVRSRFQTSFVIWARTCPRSSARGEASSYRGRARSCCAV